MANSTDILPVIQPYGFDDFHLWADRRQMLFLLCIILPAVALPIVGLRLFTSFHVVRRWHVDDSEYFQGIKTSICMEANPSEQLSSSSQRFVHIFPRASVSVPYTQIHRSFHSLRASSPSFVSPCNVQYNLRGCCADKMNSGQDRRGRACDPCPAPRHCRHHQGMS